MPSRKSIFYPITAVIAVLALIFGVLFYCLPLPGTIPVLMYHFIETQSGDAYPNGNTVSGKSFAWQMAFLKKFGYRVISLDEYYKILTGQQKPRGREVVITFDDGEMSFASKAVPILARYQFPVTMFLVSEFVKSGEHGSMGLETIKKLQEDYSWISFQSHTKTHPHLMEISETQMKDEIIGSRTELMRILGKPVTDLAYPFGQFNRECLNAAKEAGYRMAFTTGHKKLDSIPEGLFSITRIKIKDDDANFFVFWVYVSGIYHSFKAWRHHIKTRT